MLKNLAKLLLILVITLAIATAVLWLRAFKPEAISTADIQCAKDAPALKKSAGLKVMTYNVQYMASKNYVFFYDIDQNDKKRMEALASANINIAKKPSEKHVLWTLDRVAQIVREENPDVILLQEINGGDDSRTHYVDQTVELLKRLPKDTYPCHTEASYWHAEFVLHPDILGPVNMKLLTLSKYRISKSLRHQLPRPQQSAFVRPFYFQRALLESHIDTDTGETVAVVNTHYDAWSKGTDLLQRQIAITEALLQSLDRQNIAWVLGGDLNLLPPDNNRQYRSLLEDGDSAYSEQPQIKPLYEKYGAIPSQAALLSDDVQDWYTYYPNDPTVSGPDRTIDYLFYSAQWRLKDAYVRQKDTLDISDHLPVIAVFDQNDFDKRHFDKK